MQSFCRCLIRFYQMIMHAASPDPDLNSGKDEEIGLCSIIPFRDPSPAAHARSLPAAAAGQPTCPPQPPPPKALPAEAPAVVASGATTPWAKRLCRSRWLPYAFEHNVTLAKILVSGRSTCQLHKKQIEEGEFHRLAPSIHEQINAINAGM